jgi:hypothetical protein
MLAHNDVLDFMLSVDTTSGRPLAADAAIYSDVVVATSVTDVLDVEIISIDDTPYICLYTESCASGAV